MSYKNALLRFENPTRAANLKPTTKKILWGLGLGIVGLGAYGYWKRKKVCGPIPLQRPKSGEKWTAALPDPRFRLSPAVVKSGDTITILAVQEVSGVVVKDARPSSGWGPMLPRPWSLFVTEATVHDSGDLRPKCHSIEGSQHLGSVVDGEREPVSASGVAETYAIDPARAAEALRETRKGLQFPFYDRGCTTLADLQTVDTWLDRVVSLNLIENGPSNESAFRAYVDEVFGVLRRQGASCSPSANEATRQLWNALACELARQYAGQLTPQQVNAFCDLQPGAPA